MGRKQNPLVVEFFQRGAKLSDSSNRYAYTCRRCGEEFPKGRIDSLTSHLLRKCPNLSLEDRQWVFQHIQHTPERRSINKQASVNGLHATSRQEGLESQVALPQPEQHLQSALDTLAEVSRRHLDYSSQRALHDVDRDASDLTLTDITAEQALVSELRGRAEIDSLGNGDEPTKSLLYKFKASTQQTQRSPEPFLTGTSAIAASPLVQTASAANHQLELDQAYSAHKDPADSLVDPQLGESGGQGQLELTGAQSFTTQRGKDRSGKPQPKMVVQQTATGLPLVSKEPNAGFGLLQTPTKSKKRGRFDDNRRKEVSEIRKRGACIRCRMLKKPCSGETPCSTCSAVESARLWKGKCLRTRLADEFTLWSTSLFSSRAKTDTSAAMQQQYRVPVPGRIEARLFTRSNLCLSFEAKALANTINGVDPALHLHPGHDANELDKLLLSDETEGMADKLGEYASRVANVCIQEEPSMFLRATLQLAQELVNAEEAGKATKVAELQGQRSPRSSYNVQNELLKNVIELWVQTQLLAFDERHVLQLRYDPLNTPQKGPAEAKWPSAGRDHPIGNIDESSQSWRLIQSQLLAAVESRCSKLSKTVMNELERRLLQRQQVSRFATFLSAVILLNCVERMCGLYKRLDTGETPLHQASNLQAHDTRYTTTQSKASSQSLAMDTTNEALAYRNGDRPNFLPLDVPLSDLWRQGQHFSELLTMLLRMRALPPKTRENSEGTLSVAQDFTIPIHVNGQSVREQIDEQAKTAAAWLDPLRLSVAELVMKRDGEMSQQGPEAWDMKFISRLLVPETVWQSTA